MFPLPFSLAKASISLFTLPKIHDSLFHSLKIHLNITCLIHILLVNVFSAICMDNWLVCSYLGKTTSPQSFRQLRKVLCIGLVFCGPCPVWHVCWCRFSGHIWVVMLVRGIMGVASDTNRRHNLTEDSWSSASCIAPSSTIFPDLEVWECLYMLGWSTTSL